MSKGNTTENDVLAMVLTGVDPAWRGNANRYIALHTADPGEGGSQTTSECAYTSYARVAIGTGDWTDGGSSFTNTNLEQFPQCTGGSETITHVSIGTLTSGAGQILYSGALTSSLAVSNGIQPQFAAGSLAVSED
jgi:hypothetical protein